MVALFGRQSIVLLGIVLSISIPGFVEGHFNMVVTRKGGQALPTIIVVALEKSSDELKPVYNAQTNPYKVKRNILAAVIGTEMEAVWINDFKYRLFDNTDDQCGLTYSHSDSIISYFTKNEDKLESNQKLPPPVKELGPYNYPDWEIVVTPVGINAQTYQKTVLGFGLAKDHMYSSFEIYLDAVVQTQSHSELLEKFIYLLNILRPSKLWIVDDQKALQYVKRDIKDFFKVRNSNDFGNDAGPKDWVIEVEFEDEGGDLGLGLKFLFGKRIYMPPDGVPVYHVTLPKDTKLLAKGNRFYLKPSKSSPRASEVFYIEEDSETTAFSTQKPTK